jgi:hypothetical protein
VFASKKKEREEGKTTTVILLGLGVYNIEKISVPGWLSSLSSDRPVSLLPHLLIHLLSEISLTV